MRHEWWELRRGCGDRRYAARRNGACRNACVEPRSDCFEHGELARTCASLGQRARPPRRSAASPWTLFHGRFRLAADVLDDTETPGCRVVPALLFTAKTDIVCLIAGILVEPGRFGEGAVLLTSALTSCALDGPATGLIPDRVFET